MTPEAKSALHLKDVPLSATEQQLPLVRINLRDWFAENAPEPTPEEILAKAKSLGLRLLPADAALYLRLQYTKQPEEECLVIGHEPFISSAHQSPMMLFLQRHKDGKLWVKTYSAGIPINIFCFQFLFLGGQQNVQ